MNGILSQGLLNQLVREFKRRTNRIEAESPSRVLRELLNTTYAHGFKAGERDAKAQSEQSAG